MQQIYAVKTHSPDSEWLLHEREMFIHDFDVKSHANFFHQHGKMAIDESSGLSSITRDTLCVIILPGCC